MKQLVVLAGCVVVLSGLSGCRKPAQTTPPVSGVEVIIDGGGEFPEFLVGIWKADKHGWEIVFEPDGTISSVVISLGRVRIKPGQVTEVPMEPGGRGVFEAGQWTVQYSPDDRELAVEIVVDDFHIDMGSRGLKGHGSDWFVGPVSEDWQMWQVEWFTFPEYIMLAPEPVKPPFVPNNIAAGTLVFRKQPVTN